MSSIGHILQHHGYLALGLMLFLEAIGLPIPAAVALVTVGAAAAWKSLSFGYIIVCGVLPVVLADSILFLLGRKTGWALLGFLCRVSMNPETCILRSAESFYKRGRLTLLFAKFVPGVNTMAAPLAGSMRMRYLQFLQFDSLGALFYVLAYSLAGYVFSDFLKDLVGTFVTVSHVVKWVAIAAIVIYAIYRSWLYWTHRVYRVVPRVQVGEVEQRAQAGDSMLILDVRSHGYYDPGAQRIRGSVRFEPNDFKEAIKSLPKDKLIFLYCT